MDAPGPKHYISVKWMPATIMPRTFHENVLRRSEGKDERSFDREFWQRAGHEAIFAAAWEMTKEVALFRGQDAGEQRLQRHIQNIRRRKS